MRATAGKPLVLPLVTAPIRFKIICNIKTTMLRWIFVIFLALVLINAFSPFLRRMGFGKLPGDLHFKLFGREWYFPLATTLVLSFIASAVSHIL